MKAYRLLRENFTGIPRLRQSGESRVVSNAKPIEAQYTDHPMSSRSGWLKFACGRFK